MALLRREHREIAVMVAGIGRMGTYHVRALRQLAAGAAEDYYKAGLREQVGRIRLRGLCDVNPLAAAAFPDIPFSTDYDAMLDATRPALVVIAAPSRLHYRMAKAALESGIHAFVEKPVTTRLAEWDDLECTAARNALRIMAGHVERYNPVTIKLRALLDAGQISVSGYRFTRSQSHDPRIPDDIVTDKVIHDLDVAMFLFGPVVGAEVLDFKQVRGQTREVTVGLRHQGGVSGELRLSWLVEDQAKVRTCSLSTPDGRMITGDFVAKRLVVGGQAVDCHVPGWVRANNNQVKDELADFVGFCLEPDPGQPAVQPLLSMPEIRMATAIIETLSGDIARATGNTEGARADV